MEREREREGLLSLAWACVGTLRHIQRHTMGTLWQPPPTLPSYICRLERERERENLGKVGMSVHRKTEAHLKPQAREGMWEE